MQSLMIQWRANINNLHEKIAGICARHWIEPVIRNTFIQADPFAPWFFLYWSVPYGSRFLRRNVKAFWRKINKANGGKIIFLIQWILALWKRNRLINLGHLFWVENMFIIDRIFSPIISLSRPFFRWFADRTTSDTDSCYTSTITMPLLAEIKYNLKIQASLHTGRKRLYTCPRSCIHKLCIKAGHRSCSFDLCSRE